MYTGHISDHCLSLSRDRTEARTGSRVKMVIGSQAIKFRWGVTMWIDQDTKSRSF